MIVFFGILVINHFHSSVVTYYKQREFVNLLMSSFLYAINMLISILFINRPLNSSIMDV